MGRLSPSIFSSQIAPGGPVDQAIAAIEFGNAEYYPAQAVKVFVPVMRKRVSAISATVVTVADAD